LKVAIAKIDFIPDLSIEEDFENKNKEMMKLSQDKLDGSHYLTYLFAVDNKSNTYHHALFDNFQNDHITPAFLELKEKS
jgi:hypothetical protein